MPKIDDDEARIFREAMKGVRRLRSERLATTRPKRLSPPTPSVPREPPPPPWSDSFRGEDILPETPLSFSRAGLQNNVLRRLRRGQYSVEGELDLHGLTREQARHALAAFLWEMERRQARCVRIIHGKGRRSTEQSAVLKRHVDGWLRQHDRVLAFCSARREDGGTGAVYVLLKR